MIRTIRNRAVAFTLVELLVVVAIIGVLVGLLLPAVQKIRETAHGISCSNNLKQIGLALHSYHDSKNFLPASDTAIPTSQSWVPYILPYIEQEPLYNQYNFNLNWTDVNQTAVATPLKVFQCPSCPIQDRVDTTFTNPQPACGDYGATRGVSPLLVTVGLIPAPADFRGALYRNAKTQLTDITDGTSSTIMIGEDAGRPQLWNAGQLVPGGYASGGPWASPNFTVNGSSYDGSISNVGPCGINCTNNREFYSFHPAGANAVFADGSVHMLRANIPLTVLTALVTRSGAEVVPGGGDY
jgi:prepilin-type N-terminal cleavage/methylation domain-containing protein/prepilin-type processing-associated H-X9-DG protein